MHLICLRFVGEPRMRDVAPPVSGDQLVLAAVAHCRGVVVPDGDEPDAFLCIFLNEKYKVQTTS